MKNQWLNCSIFMAFPPSIYRDASAATLFSVSLAGETDRDLSTPLDTTVPPTDGASLELRHASPVGATQDVVSREMVGEVPRSLLEEVDVVLGISFRVVVALPLVEVADAVAVPFRRWSRACAMLETWPLPQTRWWFSQSLCWQNAPQ